MCLKVNNEPFRVLLFIRATGSRFATLFLSFSALVPAGQGCSSRQSFRQQIFRDPISRMQPCFCIFPVLFPAGQGCSFGKASASRISAISSAGCNPVFEFSGFVSGRTGLHCSIIPHIYNTTLRILLVLPQKKASCLSRYQMGTDICIFSHTVS